MQSTIKLWLDSENGTIYNAWNSNTAINGLSFLQGDTVKVELHLVKMAGGVNSLMEELSFPAGGVVRLAIGRISTAPVSGSFVLTYGAQSVTLPVGSTATAIQTALNGLTSIISAGGVKVANLSSTMFRIDFNAVGTNLGFSVDASAAAPPASSQVITLRAGSVSVPGSYVVKLKQSPVVYQDTWNDIEQPTLTVTELTANQSKRVSISPDPKAGSWTLTGTKDIATQVAANNGTETTGMWDINYTNRFSITANDNDIGFNNYQYSVTKVDNYAWDFTLKSYGTVPVGYTMPFVASGDGLVGFRGKGAYVAFDTAEIEYLLNGATSQTAILEVEIQDSTGNRHTVTQTTVTIKNDLIDNTGFSPVSSGSTGIPDAPVDGKPYVRKDGAWLWLDGVDGGTY
jgi:hypothetical protein